RIAVEGNRKLDPRTLNSVAYDHFLADRVLFASLGEPATHPSLARVADYNGAPGTFAYDNSGRHLRLDDDVTAIARKEGGASLSRFTTGVHSTLTLSPWLSKNRRQRDGHQQSTWHNPAPYSVRLAQKCGGDH